MKTIILASQSPRRKLLLEWAEIAFKVAVSATSETFPEEMPVEDAPVHIARNKALAVSSALSAEERAESVIIAADTVVVLENEIIGKPIDRDQAITILGRLSGKRHKVITGVVILGDGQQETAFADITEVDFHELTRQQIVFYVDKYLPFDKAGAYAIQEWIGVTGIKSIHGDFYNVMGLPVSRVVKALREFS